MTKIIPILLLIGIALAACAGFPASAPAQEPVGTPANPPGDSCTSPENWAIQFNRSGGFAGFNQSLTLDSGGSLTVQSERPPANMQRMLADEQVKEITDLLVQACPFEPATSDAVCADCFLYELNIQMDGQSYRVQATDITLTEELHSLTDALSALFLDTSQ